MHFFPRKSVSPRPLGLAPSRLKRVIESPLLSPQKRRRCKAWAVLRFFLFLFLPSVAPCTNRQKVREKKKEGLSAGSKRAMHSLHHHDVTRPSRPRQVVSCSSRSDGSKKRTEPTKEVKSLICQTKQGGFLFSYSSLSSFFLLLLLLPLLLYPPAIYSRSWMPHCLLPKTQSHATLVQPYRNEDSSRNKRLYKVG